MGKLAIDFGRPNAEIGRKMANSRLLFLALTQAVCHSNNSYTTIINKIKATVKSLYNINIIIGLTKLSLVKI